MHEALLLAAKAAAWQNEPRGVKVFGGEMYLALHEAHAIAMVEPAFGLAILATTPIEHYLTIDAASESMIDVAETLKTPLRMWHNAALGSFFFAHASLDATPYGALAVASHHPCTA